jgi:lipopolysaccharide/colanic/teichoic acid biosynthesis glycosyltransferase
MPAMVGTDRAPQPGPGNLFLALAAGGVIENSRDQPMMRWVHSLVDQPGAAPTIQKLWNAERDGEQSQRRAEQRREMASSAINIVIALTMLVLLFPLMAVIAVLVWLTSPGPILYTQTRVGLDRRLPRDAALNHRRQQNIGGRPFTIYKFRTMRVDAENGSGAVWAQQRDPRVTSIGRLLRQYRLDELPQLLNVVRGEMNIVGPRPERPTIFAELREHIAEYPLRQRAKPGITGLAQINHHPDVSLDDVRTKVQYDLEYIRRQSIVEDFRIMLKTVPTMLRRRGW